MNGNASIYLARARDSLGAADRHLAAVKRAFEAYVRTLPQRTVKAKDPRTGEIVVRVRIDKPVPAGIGETAGNVVHDLRMSLDLLACALVARNGGVPTPATRFPFADNAGALYETVDRHLAGAGHRGRRFVRRLRPYRGGNTRVWSLHLLDTHSTPNAAVRTAAMIESLPAWSAPFATKEEREAPAIVTNVDNRPGVPPVRRFVSPLVDNIEVHRAPASPFPEQVRVGFILAFDGILVPDGETVLQTLGHLRAEVAKAIADWEKSAGRVASSLPDQ